MNEAKAQRVNEAKIKLDGGDLKGANQEALAAVKATPTDATARTFLFELSCFTGEWDRAEKQLEVIGHQDVNAMIGAQIYKQNISAERDRLRHFADGLMPECVMTPPKYVENLLVANNHIREGRLTEAREILDEVENERPAFSGKLNGKPFSDFRDFNDLTSCVFEAIIKGSYTWLPFEQVKQIRTTAPKTLRDRYWVQTEFEMENGTNGEMFLPALYVNSWKSDDDLVRLGRATNWTDVGNDIYFGEGLRVFQFDAGHTPIFDIETIGFDHENDDSSGE